MTIQLVNRVCDDIDQFLQQYPQGVVVFWGATATGKTHISLEVARRFSQEGRPCEIISADSRQIFRFMNIGTDKVPETDRMHIPHYQIDIVDPDEFYTAGQWKADTVHHIDDIHNRSAIPFIVGGTGLYIDTLYKNYSVPAVASDFTLRALWQQKEDINPGVLWKRLHAIDPEEAKKHHPHSTRYIIRALEIYEKTGHTKTASTKEQSVQRPLLLLGFRRETADTNKRIETRVHHMIAQGLEKETHALIEKGYTRDLQSMQGIGYKETRAYLAGEITKQAWEQGIILHTHQYAKRQRTWFRRYITDSQNNPKDAVVYKLYHMTE